MKVLLLNPPFKNQYGRFSRTSRSPAITKSGTLYYPFWLAYAAGVLEDNGFEVRLVDAAAAQLPAKEVLSQIEGFAPKMVVIDTSTPSIHNDLSIGCVIKRHVEDVWVVVVGTHPSALPVETLEMAHEIDCVCLGEYDYTVRDLANCIRRKGNPADVPGLVFRRNGKIIRTGIRTKIEDLDSLPFVSRVYRTHLDYRKYFFSAAKYPMVMIISGRGCPHRCFYCVYPQIFHGKRYRLRSPKNVVDEFEYILEAFPRVKSIGIEDDTFTANKTRVKEICRLLINRGLNRQITWWANTRVDLNFEIMALMKTAGCSLLIPGFESGSQEILDSINKEIKIETSIRFMENARKAGLNVHGCFMVGNPGETIETMQKTLNFAMRLSPDTAQFFPMIPYPGTKAFEWATKNGYLNFESYSDWLTEDGLHNTILEPNNLTSKELVDFCNYARKRYYLRCSYVWRKIKQSMKDFYEFKRNFKAFRTLLRHLIKR